MKKVIRLTESDLMRIVKRVISEDDKEDRLEHFIDVGFDNLVSLYLVMLEGDMTWTELFNMYGKVISDSLFYNDYRLFVNFVLNNDIYKDEMLRGSHYYFDEYLKDHYPEWDGKHSDMIDILINHFFDGDKKKMILEYGNFIFKNPSVYQFVERDNPIRYESTLYSLQIKSKYDWDEFTHMVQLLLPRNSSEDVLERIIDYYEPFNLESDIELYNLFFI